MLIEEKVFLTGFVNKHGVVNDGYLVTGSTYLLLGGLVDLQERGYIQIESKKGNLTGISCKILNTNTAELTDFQLAIFRFVENNPEFKDPVKNSEFLTNTKVFEIVREKLMGEELITKRQSKFLFFSYSNHVLTPEGKQQQEVLVQEIRANLLEEGEIDLDIIALVLILDKLSALKQYFSDYEQREIKAKIEKLKSANPEISTKILNIVSYISSFDDTFVLIMGAVS
jgi:cell division protein ZapA (FtsZ GTPase activity inhibitor)